MATNSSTKVQFTISQFSETIYGSADGWGGFRTNIVCSDGNGNKGYIHFYDSGDSIPKSGIQQDSNGSYYGTFCTTAEMLQSVTKMLNSGNPVIYYLDLDQGSSGQAYVGMNTVKIG